MDLFKIILVVLSGLGVFHGVFVAIVLWSFKSNPKTANKVLAALMIILSLRIGKSVVLEFNNQFELLYVYLGLCLLMFIGPLFLLYSTMVVTKKEVESKKFLLHLLPGISFLLLAVPFQIIGFRNLPSWLAIGLFVSFYTHLFVYLLIVTFKVIKGSQLQVETQWLNMLWYSLVAVWIVYVLNMFEDGIPYVIGPIIYSIVVYTITFMAISRRYLHTINNPKYQSSNIPDIELLSLFNNLEKFITEEKLYLNPELSLALLSKQLKATPQKISLAINSRSGYNFNDYINKLRVDHATQLMKRDSGKTQTIASIATDAGFNSISTFNTAFKKFTGQTPSALRKGTS